VYSISPAIANNYDQKFNLNSNYKLVTTNADGSINVKLSDDQLNKIIPKNEDGSINVKMAPDAVMDVNLMQITGQRVAKKTADNGAAVLWVGNWQWD
jgi:hypothetical protein